MDDVPRLTKSEWPVYITDALGIPSIEGRGGPWQSTGDTTDLAWFQAMCDFLGVAYPGERIRAMHAIIEAAGGTWEQARHSSAVPGKQAGGNVRREAFEDLWVALHESGHLDSSDAPSLTSDALTHHADDTAVPEARWVYQHIRLRQGQPGFRRRLINAYDGRCAVTGSNLQVTLEAAHIQPHSKGGSMTTSNGLLLRADLHTLFDLGLMAIDTSAWRVLLHESIRATETGRDLHGRSLRLPLRDRDHPSVAALDEHRRRCGLGS
jgi:hypothetical protein